MESQQISIADLIAKACAERGVKRAFGVPGGGSALDLIEAFGRHGIEFVLCRGETPATLMAAADAESRNGFGVAITTQGPGLACAMNGLAYSALDRAPVLLISDTWTARQLTFDTHQVIDQEAIARPLLKGHSRLESESPALELAQVLDRMLQAPWGPGYIELTRENARRKIPVGQLEATRQAMRLTAQSRGGDVRRQLQQARRPVLIVGLEARGEGVPARVLALAQRLACPVLTTYKAKGVVSDESGWVVGHFTGGAVEGPCLEQADLIVLCGLDPVELIGKPWPYRAPVVEFALARHPVHYVEPAAFVHGPLTEALDEAMPICQASDWSRDEILELRGQFLRRLAYRGSGSGISPQDAVQAMLRHTDRSRAYATVDAGAHMFSAMAFWQARHPGGALISNGLSTMAYALPAGIARALANPDATTIVFTGDGGLKMCIGELATAAQYGARICVVVFNDCALSLIALKQQDRDMKPEGVSWPRTDFSAVAHGFGVKGFRADTLEEYEEAISQALREPGPTLIDARIDPTGYRSQARSQRG